MARTIRGENSGMDPMLNMAIRAARQAGDIIMRKADRLDTIDIKTKSPHNYVTSVDHMAEEQIVHVLKTAYPDHDIKSEECGLIQAGETPSTHLWIIDPLDGTHNFIKGLPNFCVSIALVVNGITELGVIYQPVTHDLYTAIRGQSAQLNRHRIQVSPQRDLSGAFVSLSLKGKVFQSSYTPFIMDLIENQAVKYRRSGSTALDMAYIAAGSLDVFWRDPICCWDVAAGALLIKEAGGLVSDLKGNPDILNGHGIMACNPKLMKTLLPQLVKHIKTES